MSYLTEQPEALRRDLIAALEGEGFSYNSLRTNWTEYLATALGQPNAYLFKSEGQLLTELDAAYGGSLSHLRVSIAHLVDDLVANIGAGGGGGGYQAKAVTFDGSQYLDIASLTATNNAFCTTVFFVRQEEQGTAPILWVVDPANAYREYLGLTTANSVQIRFVDSDFQGFQVFSSEPDDPGFIDLRDGHWHSVVFVTRNSTLASERAFKVFVDRTEITNIDLNSDSTNGTWSFDGTPMTLFADTFGDNFVGDIADYRIISGIDLLDVDGNLPEATLNLFVTADNKPVDPSVATAFLGTPGMVLLSGDASTFGINQNTDNELTLHGTPANASTSPSD